MAYYRATFFILGALLLLCSATVVTTSWWCGRQRDSFKVAAYEALRSADQQLSAEGEERLLDQQVGPLRAFVKAWEPHLQPAAPKDLGNVLRNAMATLATRTGLTSEGATVPGDPRAYSVAGSVIKVQQVSLSVISESLPAIVTWLGAVEEQFPYARIESLTLSGYASRSVQLGVTVLHPIESAAPVRTPGTVPPKA